MQKIDYEGTVWVLNYNNPQPLVDHTLLMLEKHGIKLGDTVSVMAANTPELFEAHYSVPMAGAVLNAINTRLDSKTVGYILKHADAKVLIVDRQFMAL